MLDEFDFIEMELCMCACMCVSEHTKSRVKECQGIMLSVHLLYKETPAFL